MAKKGNRKKRRKNKVRNRKVMFVTLLSLVAVLAVVLIGFVTAGRFSAKSQDGDKTSDEDSLVVADVRDEEVTQENMTNMSQTLQTSQETAAAMTAQDAGGLDAAGDGEGKDGAQHDQALDEAGDRNGSASELADKGDDEIKNDRNAINNTGENESESGQKEQEEQREHPPIETLQQIDPAGLSTEALGWGQGAHFDEQNRPVGSLSYQEKYGKYQAYFIADPEQVVYLTFDEGYEYGCTPQILDVLKEKDVKAVFFITLPYAKSHPELVQRMIDEAHQLGNHSVTHPSQGLPSLSMEQQRDEVMGCHDYVKENFGYEMHLFRYPTGKFSEQSLAIVNNCNYKSVFWSFAYLDYDVNHQPDEAESLKKLVDRLHPGAIYLLHAESVTNTNILGSLIDQGRALGYSFEMFW